jgi:hypothetical protein
MHTSSLVRQALVAGGLFALGVLVACSDAAPTSDSGAVSSDAANPVSKLTAADIVVPGTDAGAFTNPVVANQSGWSTTEFWDNLSDDGANCNVGFWATGVMGSCLNEAPGSTANQGGYTKYWGNGPEDRATSSFMFKGTYAYRVTLLASYALENSEVGWFTVSGGVYTFHAVTGWGTKAIGTSTIISPPAGANWGLYIKHEGHGATGSCATDTDCTDATGDMHTGTPPSQQFALFTNAGESKFLVGVEDNDEGAVVIGDDDFQDFILSVEPFQVPMFVIGDVEAHGLDDTVNFWGAQWWKNNEMSGLVSHGVAAFKGYATTADNFCGGVWSTRPGNSSNPPAVIPAEIAIIVTSKVVKSGSSIGGDIREILIVTQDGHYGPNPGHAGNGTVTRIVCPAPE